MEIEMIPRRCWTVRYRAASSLHVAYGLRCIALPADVSRVTTGRRSQPRQEMALSRVNPGSDQRRSTLYRAETFQKPALLGYLVLDAARFLLGSAIAVWRWYASPLCPGRMRIVIAALYWLGFDPS